ncbi:hypothetical protein EON66_02635, partial [archaeon]
MLHAGVSARRPLPLQASMLPDPADIFKFMQTNNIGTEHAIMYYSWASVAEMRRNWSFASKVYQRGVACGAMPAEIMRRRQREFQHRA